MRFGGLIAVDSVGMTVHAGEIVGLIGPNGAGSTTFFNCLTGMYKPTSGQVTSRGRCFLRSRVPLSSPGWRGHSRTSACSPT